MTVGLGAHGSAALNGRIGQVAPEAQPSQLITQRYPPPEGHAEPRRRPMCWLSGLFAAVADHGDNNGRKVTTKGESHSYSSRADLEPQGPPTRDIAIRWDRADNSPVGAVSLERRCSSVAELRFSYRPRRADPRVVAFPWKPVRLLAGDEPDECHNGHGLSRNDVLTCGYEDCR